MGLVYVDNRIDNHTVTCTMYNFQSIGKKMQLSSVIYEKYTPVASKREEDKYWVCM